MREHRREEMREHRREEVRGPRPRGLGRIFEEKWS